MISKEELAILREENKKNMAKIQEEQFNTIKGFVDNQLLNVKLNIKLKEKSIKEKVRKI